MRWPSKPATGREVPAPATPDDATTRMPATDPMSPDPGSEAVGVDGTRPGVAAALRRHRRRWIVGGVALMVAAGAVWAIAARRDKDEAPAAKGGMAGMPGMEGMSGMEGMGGMSVDADGSVRLTAGQISQFGITFGTAEVRALTSESRTVGSVTYNEATLARVTPKVGGYVERLYIDVTGQPVRRGQPMLELFSPELVAAQEELLVARRLDRTLGESSVPGVASAPGLLAAARRRLRLLDISDAQIDEVLRTGRSRRTLTLYAPTTGIVIEKNVVQGQAIQAGESLYSVANLATVWVDIELRESDAGRVRAGTAVDLEFAAYPGRTFKGRVEYVYPTLEKETRTIRARVAVSNTGQMLKPGMYATARLLTAERRALTIPASALVRTGERNVVFVDMGGGRLMPHDVEVGPTMGDYVEVIAGLEPGQRVVTSAQFLLESESNLGEVMKAMMSMGAGGMEGMEGMEGMDMPGMKMDAPKSAPAVEKGADMRNMPGMQPAPAPRPGARP